MSQVLQWTQFCALITAAGRLVDADVLVDRRRAIARLGAGVERPVDLSGSVGSLSLRWHGWFSAWLVPERNTDDRRSKLITPSGLG
jgi:hypothetical protein